MRGAIGPNVGLFKQAAKEIKAILKKEGVADMPLGLDICEPPMLFALQEEGIEVRDGQQMMLLAREQKNHDEITLLNIASSMVDGVYQDIAAALKPGVKESQIVALATKRERGSGIEGGHIRRALQSASPQFYGSPDSPRRPRILRHHSLLHWISHLLLQDVHRREFYQLTA